MRKKTLYAGGALVYCADSRLVSLRRFGGWSLVARRLPLTARRFVRARAVQLTLVALCACSLLSLDALAQPVTVVAVISCAGQTMSHPESHLKSVCVVAQPGPVAVSRDGRFTQWSGFLRVPATLLRRALRGGVLIRFQ